MNLDIEFEKIAASQKNWQSKIEFNEEEDPNGEPKLIDLTPHTVETDDSIYLSTEGTNPREYSKYVTSLYLASLPKAIALIGNHVCPKHLKLLINIDKTKRRIDNLGTTSDKFPKSMEFNFKLGTIDSMKEDPRFKKLEQEADGHITYCVITADKLLSSNLPT